MLVVHDSEGTVVLEIYSVVSLSLFSSLKSTNPFVSSATSEGKHPPHLNSLPTRSPHAPLAQRSEVHHPKQRAWSERSGFVEPRIG
jgi:hypothetical protein